MVYVEIGRGGRGGGCRLVGSWEIPEVSSATGSAQSTTQVYNHQV